MSNYYDTCAISKPGARKKEAKKTNGYKDKPNRICYYCGKSSAERHEVFGGSNRQISIDNEFQIDVCAEHHKELHEGATPWSIEENLKWRQHYQSKYINELVKTLGLSKKEARAEWKSLIGKFY